MGFNLLFFLLQRLVVLEGAILLQDLQLSLDIAFLAVSINIIDSLLQSIAVQTGLDHVFQILCGPCNLVGRRYLEFAVVVIVESFRWLHV